MDMITLLNVLILNSQQLKQLLTNVLYCYDIVRIWELSHDANWTQIVEYTSNGITMERFQAQTCLSDFSVLTLIGQLSCLHVYRHLLQHSYKHGTLTELIRQFK